MKHTQYLAWTLAMSTTIFSCSTDQKTASNTTDSTSTNQAVRIITLDPGHFHAALVQKTMYSNVDSTVHVFAPEGSDVQDHLKRIEGYNSRPENPTKWKEEVYTGTDYLEKMIAQKPGNVVVISGNNLKKAEYIKKSVDAGLNVLADKPMCIDSAGFEILKQSFESAEKNNVLLYDIMTERSEITNTLQKELSQIPEIFGELQKGTPQDPAVTKESVHHFFKFVSGSALKRPAWFMDVAQQGEGLVDVTTHLVDLVQWECFPEQVIDTKDIELLQARRWTTPMTRSQFTLITQQPDFPEYLRKDVRDTVLNVYSNGEITYKIKGIHAKVSVIWNYKAPEGAGDTHFSIMKGSKANLVIRQGAEEKYIPKLYIEAVKGTDAAAYENAATQAFAAIQTKYPGVELKKSANTKWQVMIPDKYRVGHEAHFGEVTERYLQYLEAGKLPDWEVPNMITKYYTTIQALRLAKQGKQNISAR